MPDASWIGRIDIVAYQQADCRTSAVAFWKQIACCVRTFIAVERSEIIECRVVPNIAELFRKNIAQPEFIMPE